MYQIEANDPGIVKASEVKDLSGDLHKEFLKIFKFLFIFFQQQEHLLRLGNTIKMCESLAWMTEEKERRTRVFATIKHPYWVCWVCLHQHRLLSFVLIQVSQGWESFAEIVHCQTFSASCFEFVFPQKCSDFQTVACFRERKKKKKRNSVLTLTIFIFEQLLAIMCAFCWTPQASLTTCAIWTLLGKLGFQYTNRKQWGVSPGLFQPIEGLEMGGQEEIILGVVLGCTKT